MRDRSCRFFVICALVIALSATSALARPGDASGEVGSTFSRIAAAVRHFIRALGDDLSVPHP